MHKTGLLCVTMRRNCKRKRKSERERESRSVLSGALLELPYGHATMRRDALSLLFEGVQEARSRHKSHEYGIPWSLGGKRAARTYPKHECMCIEQCRHRAFFASFRARMMRRASAFLSTEWQDFNPSLVTRLYAKCMHVRLFYREVFHSAFEDNEKCRKCILRQYIYKCLFLTESNVRRPSFEIPLY